MADPLTAAHAEADRGGAAWEALEGVREASSEKAERERGYMAAGPHRGREDPQTPGFCRCSFRLGHSIHA